MLKRNGMCLFGRWALGITLGLATEFPATAEEQPAPPPFTLQIRHLIPAPSDPAQWPLFREELRTWRQAQREALKYDDRHYRRPEFAWGPSNYVCYFAMMCDETFYDPVRGEYVPERLADYGKREYGGFDSIIYWHAYPRIGFDARNQFDFFRDMPGGLDGLRRLTARFHARNIKVFIPYKPWDVGTRREGKSDLDALVEMVAAINADGIFLDTWPAGWGELRSRLDEARPGVVLEPELGLPLPRVADHHMSWAQGFGDSPVPGVLMLKYFERRHIQHNVSRLNKDQSPGLQSAWMNGSGMVVWENVFGAWGGWNPRDRSILRSMTPIQRRYTPLFSGEGWTPLVETLASNVYASLWEGNGLRLWTLCNRDTQPKTGPLMRVPHRPGDRYFDLVRGIELTVRPTDEGVVLEGEIEPRWIGCFLATPQADRGLRRFLQQQAEVYRRREASTDFPVRSERLKPVERTRFYTPADLPEGMAVIKGGEVEIAVTFTPREGGTYQTPHRRKVRLTPYAVDVTPVTNEQFEKFLRATGYKPRHAHNFLKHWTDGKIPEGKKDHPVVYVDLEDARAYARWAGKRLLTEEEWQYAAQGPAALKYPWGNEMLPGRCNDGSTTQDTTSVWAYPEGRSPFGCYDLCGNTWEWTESERSDGRTRFCIIRGGSYFKAHGSGWYTDGGPMPTHHAAKFLLMWPGLDRCATIGFRCAVDFLPDEDAPPVPQTDAKTWIGDTGT